LVFLILSSALSKILSGECIANLDRATRSSNGPQMLKRLVIIV
jgi:hypothetical protein